MIFTKINDNIILLEIGIELKKKRFAKIMIIYFILTKKSKKEFKEISICFLVKISLYEFLLDIKRFFNDINTATGLVLFH